MTFTFDDYIIYFDMMCWGGWWWLHITTLYRQFAHMKNHEKQAKYNYNFDNGDLVASYMKEKKCKQKGQV